MAAPDPRLLIWLAGLTILGGLLGGGSPKPRNRSEWTERFANWSAPASDTEEQKIERGRRAIHRALEKDEWLESQRYEIVKQGSYHNNTNVKNRSDLDLVVCHSTAHFFHCSDGSSLGREEIGFTPLTFEFDDYKNHIAEVLSKHFGSASVRIGEKAIKLHGDDDGRIDADVVPAFQYDLYQPKSAWIARKPLLQAEGISFRSSSGELIFNFPKQHYENGVAKNDQTSRRYKRVVRILKRMREHMNENGLPVASDISSFAIECLVFNCPNSDFASDDIYVVVQEVLLTLHNALKSDQRSASLIEVNGIKMFFRDGQKVSRQAALNFVEATYQYVEFA